MTHPILYPKKSLVFPRAGWLYVIGFTKFGIYKIGITTQKTPKLRLRQFRRLFELLEVGHPLDYAVAYATDECRFDERALHQTFWSQRIDGEYFELSRADLRYIEQRWGSQTGLMWMEPKKEYNPGFIPKKLSVSVSHPDPLERRLEAANRTAISKLNKHRRII